MSTTVDGTFVKSEVSAFKTLAHEPETIDIPNLDLNANFSIGYAQFYLDPNSIGKIKLLNKHFTFIECVDSVRHSYGFFPLHKNRITFEVELKALETYPKTSFQIFCMSKEEFSEYMERCYLKKSWTFNQNGTGVFENENLKGIIRFGTTVNPNTMYVDVFSKKTAMTQRVLVRTDSPEKTRESLLSLISSFSYLIEKPMDKNAIKQMAFDVLSRHPKFQAETP
ncbi:MAG: hypothetical protein FVQ82_13065 [Planctomycetes bacterium]|nr:hypothetical protein [Planctomycetota bacterium]